MTDARIPLFPLNTVLFPGGPLALRIFETRYLDMVKDCARNDDVFGVCLILKGREAAEAAVTTVRTGTTARIVDFFTTEDGLLGIRASGERRFQIQHTSVRDSGLIVAEVELLPPPPPQPLPTEYLLLRTLLERLLEKVGEHYPERSERDLDDADWVASRLTELLPLDNTVKQVLLEESDPVARLARLLELVPSIQGE